MGTNDRIPNCYVAGAPRCGTTFLSLALAAHPDVFLCEMKEPHHFGSPADGYRYDGPGDSYLNGTWIADESAYLSLYAGRTEPIWVDGSTTLMFWPDAVREIVRRAPDAWFFVVLRDPVARAVSAYTRLRAQGLEPANTLAAAVEHELAGHRASWSPGFRYVEQGRYADALDAVEAVVGERLRILRFVDLVGDPEVTVRNAWRTLGVSDDVEVVVPAETNATPHVANPVLRYLFVRPLRIRSVVSRRVPAPIVRRLKTIRASRRATSETDEATERRLREIFGDDLERLERDRGIVLAESP